MVLVLQAKEKYKAEPANHTLLKECMIMTMCELAKNDFLGFEACMWDFVAFAFFVILVVLLKHMLNVIWIVEHQQVVNAK